MDLITLKNKLEKPFSLEKPQLKECFVAYVDILGYRYFFENFPERVDSLLENITNAYQSIVRGLDYINGLHFSEEKIKLHCFSDNLLLYCEVSDQNSFERTQSLLLLIESVKEIQRILIFNYGLFVRGAITKGSFAANEMFVFGKALIEAVVKEETVAKNPRVIISHEVIDDIKSDIVCDDIAAQRVNDELAEVYALFKSDSNDELARRCLVACKTFDKIIAEIPHLDDDYREPVHDLQKRFDTLAMQISDNRSNAELLERIYAKIFDEKSSILSLFEKVAARRQKTFIEYMDISTSSCYSEDEDGIFFVDYLNRADYTTVVRREAFYNFFQGMSEYPDFIERHVAYWDKNTLNTIRHNNLCLHRRAVCDTLKNDKESYLQYVPSNRDSKYDERIVKKHGAGIDDFQFWFFV